MLHPKEVGDRSTLAIIYALPPSRLGYEGEVDEFAVFCPETNGVYSIPIEDLGPRDEASLRVDPPRNNQAKFIRFAQAYEIAKIDVY